MSAPAPDPRPLLLHVFSTFAVGGQQTRFVALAAALHDKYRHAVLAMDGDLGAAALLDPRVACSFVSIPVRKSAAISLANLIHAGRLIGRLRPDLLLTYNWGSLEWALANLIGPRRPHMHLEDGFGPEESPTRQLPRRVWMRRLVLRRSPVVVPSHTLFAVATQRWRLREDRVVHIPNGIVCDRFERAADPALLARFGIPAGAQVVGTVAGLRREKNLARLLRVFAALGDDPGTVLVIVGDGPQRQELAALATELGIAGRVVMTGNIPQPEQIIGRFDVFALTSDTEQMPNSIIEAMAAALPVVATDVGDVKRVLADDNAPYVLPCDDHAGLAAALARLLADPDLRRRTGAQNRRKVSELYDFTVMRDRHDALISSLLRRHGR